MLLLAALAAVLESCAQKREPADEPANKVDESVKPEKEAKRASIAPAGKPPRTARTGLTLRGREQFVGSAACATCHPNESQAYAASHHAKALVRTSNEDVAPHLDGARFTSKHGGTTTFTTRGTEPVVDTPVANGEQQVLPVPYVSGVWPLQQYVVATERGKLQALGVSWDSRSKNEGGNHWFHVYGADGIAPHDPLFFTSATQNWNHMCADCHSTWVERRYDATQDSFDTQWAELSVGCEACHGPGAEHVRSARENPTNPTRFAVSLQYAEPWVPSSTGSPVPRVQDGVQVQACAPCHSRRAPLAEGFIASDSLLDHFEPELLWPGRYHADGQVEGEVYEWGSFTQSRMYQAGVTCSDCHNPHSGKPYASGDALCGRCHEPERFQAPAHSHHSGPNAPQCIDCHMPPATFMQVDERRDHSIRIPRPDHSVAFGTPNACTTCHDQQSANWARQWTQQWYPTLEQRPHFVEALGKDRNGAPDAHQALRRLVSNTTAPAIARATAAERLGNYPNPNTIDTLRTALGDDDALIAYGAALGATALAPAQRLSLLLPVVRHPVRAVRIAAAKGLEAVPNGSIPPVLQPALRDAKKEVERSFDVSASRAETHVERGAFELAQGKFAQAEASLQNALRLSPCLTEAHLNQAELRRQRQDEVGAELAIRRALACSPNNAGAHHALGLWRVRAKQPQAALASLRKATELAAADARFSYVFAVALANAGQVQEAVRVLEANLVHHNNDVASLRALNRYLAEIGQAERAKEVHRRLDGLIRD